MNLSLVVAIMLLIVGGGNMLDQYSFKKEKVKLHKWIQSLITKLDTYPLKNFPRLYIETSYGIINKLLRFDNKWISVLIIFLISWVVTTVFSVYGYYNPSCNCNEVPEASPWYDYLPLYSVYLISFVFLALSVFVSFVLLRKAIHSSFFKMVSLFNINIIICFFIAYFCNLALSYHENILADSIPLANKFSNVDIGVYDEELGGRFYEFYTPESLDEYVVFEEFTKADIYELWGDSTVSSDFIYDYWGDSTYALVVMPIYYSSIDVYIQELYYFIIHDGDISSIVDETLLLFEEDLDYSLFEATYEAYYPYNSISVAISASSLYIVCVYTFILFVMIVLRLLLLFTKAIFVRIAKTSIDGITAAKIEDFKPGTHFGAAISFAVLILSLIKEYLSK